MVSQAELKKRRVKAGKQQVRQEQVVDRRDRRRRLWMSVFIVILALALIAPLAAGLFLDADDGDTQPEPDPIQLTETTPPSLVDAEFAGASLTGETPCPATDGSQARVTSFETAPAGCIDPTADYSVEFGTIAGPIDVALDAAGEPVATDLFVSLARYGVYEGLPILQFDGVVVFGNFGDAGFNITLDESPANAEYPVGSIVLLTELGTGALTGQAAIITSEQGAELVANDGGTSPIIGMVTGGQDAIDELVRLATENTSTTYRLRGATVTESTG